MNKTPEQMPENRIVVIHFDELQAMMRSLLQEQAQNLLQSISDRQPQIQKTDEIKFLTRIEAANRLRITLPTLNKRMRDGRIGYMRIGRRVLIPESEVQNER